MPTFEETDRMALQAAHTPRRRKIVTLCGSTKFWRTFQRAGLQETMHGHIVLSIGAASGTDDDHFGNLKPEEYEAIKDSLDTLHYDKIAMSDEILVLDALGRDGQPYIGTSTRAEIAFAERMGVIVRYWSVEQGIKPVDITKTVFTDDELRYAAYARCKCGAGLAYVPERALPTQDNSMEYWDCSDILTGRAKILNKEDGMKHDPQHPFAFYSVKPEGQPSANGATTRPDSKATLPIDPVQLKEKPGLL